MGFDVPQIADHSVPVVVGLDRLAARLAQPASEQLIAKQALERPGDRFGIVGIHHQSRLAIVHGFGQSARLAAKVQVLIWAIRLERVSMSPSALSARFT